MIKIGLEFHLAVNEVIEVLVDLPGPMRPQHYSDAEAEPADRLPIGERADFLRKMKKRKGGILLYGSQVTYSVRGTAGRIFCDGFADVDQAVIESIFSAPHFARCHFGYACLEEEYKARNRVVVQRGINSIEAWVGRDTRKVVPGLYWMTLMSKDLVEKLGVEVDKLAAEAVDCWDISNLCFVFKMGVSPQLWQERLGNGRLTGEPWLFDMAQVSADVDTAQDLMSTLDALGRWN